MNYVKITILTLLASLSFAVAQAQTVEGLIVTTSEGEQTFAISEIRDITFADEGMTIVRTDDVAVSFDNAEGWQIRFGEVEPTAISFGVQSGEEAVVEVLDVDGVLVKKGRMSDIRFSELPKGVYIIKRNGKSLKIQR